MSTEPLKVGEELLAYVASATTIKNQLQEALFLANTLSTEVNERIYVGGALIEMQMFYQSLREHIACLSDLYDKAGRYMGKTYADHYYNEAQIQKLMNSVD